jgi:hypothetical protein
MSCGYAIQINCSFFFSRRTRLNRTTQSAVLIGRIQTARLVAMVSLLGPQSAVLIGRIQTARFVAMVSLLA